MIQTATSCIYKIATFKNEQSLFGIFKKTQTIVAENFIFTGVHTSVHDLKISVELLYST